MLVCNVSMRARRVGIAADIAEIATAVDATATGNVVFATLVDDPASVGDRVDAYLGEIMLEAASANAVVNAGFASSAVIAETAAAAEAVDAALAVPSKSAMVPRAFINPSTSRAANANGIMVNL